MNADSLSNVVRLPVRKDRLRGDVPPFDPANPVHLRAWEMLWDFGKSKGSEKNHFVA